MLSGSSTGGELLSVCCGSFGSVLPKFIVIAAFDRTSLPSSMTIFFHCASVPANKTSESFPQSLKASLFICFSEAGIQTEVRLLHPEKADDPIVSHHPGHNQVFCSF